MTAIEDRAVRAGLTDRSPVPVIWPLLKDEFTRAVAVHTEHLEWSRQVGQLPLGAVAGRPGVRRPENGRG